MKLFNKPSPKPPVKTREEFLEDFQKRHDEYMAEQVALEQTFDLSEIDVFKILIWDDVDKCGITNMYLDNSDIPNKFEVKVLIHLLNFIESNPQIQKTGINFDLILYNAFTEYTNLVDTNEGKFFCTQKWKIQLSNLGDIGENYELFEEKIDLLEKELAKAPKFKNKSFTAYSES